jgi:hypothetical protein
MDPTLTSEPVANSASAAQSDAVGKNPIVAKLFADLRIVLRDMCRALLGITNTGAQGPDG